MDELLNELLTTVIKIKDKAKDENICSLPSVAGAEMRFFEFPVSKHGGLLSNGSKRVFVVSVSIPGSVAAIK